MKLAVIGSRSFDDYSLLQRTLADLVRTEKITHIVSGGARGADSLAERFAAENNLETVIFIPDWKKHGKGAGMVRNRLIIDASDMVLAFWDGASTGTKHSLAYARRQGKRVVVVESGPSKAGESAVPDKEKAL
jgi:predicted Rossmann fold nucleotide-binding protein DprA/Smf involved in DNA uptake